MKRSRYGALLPAVAVIVALMPSTALAVPPSARGARTAARVRSASAYYAADAWESGLGDDTEDNATDITSLFGAVGGDLYLQGHTISEAPTDPLTADEDWYRFDVSPTDLLAGTSYLIEADFRAAPSHSFYVIEVYGAGISNVNPSRPPTSGTDIDSPLSGCIAPEFPGDMWHDDGGVSSVSFVPPGDGTYWFRVRPWREDPATALPGYENYGNTAGPYTLRIKKGFMTRAAGPDRVQTSVRFSQELYPTGILTTGGSDAFGDAVVIANGWNYPDALAGSALAGALNAPLLLTAPRTLSTAVRTEIDRLRPQKIFILGGTTAVYPAVQDALELLPTGAPASVTRISGSGRVETAKEIARKLYNDGGGGGIGPAFVVNGWAFPDALSAAPLASLNNAPILLTHTTGLDTVTRDAIVDYGVTDVVIVGSTAAVDSTVEGQLAIALGGADHVRRVQGWNRYETSAEFAAWATGLRGSVDDPPRVGTVANPDMLQALEPNIIGVASGQNFPDALSGGVWAGHAFAPLLLTPPWDMSPYIYSFDAHEAHPGRPDYWSEVNDATGKGFERSYLFGGPGAVSNDTYYKLDSITGAAGSL